MEVWKRGMELVVEIYLLTDKLPREEVYGLSSQLRRASVGILANLAEGFSRSSNPDKAYKYTISRGECSEVHALLLVCVRLQLLSEEEAKKALLLNAHTGKLRTGLIQKYSSNPSPSPSPLVM